MLRDAVMGHSSAASFAKPICPSVSAKVNIIICKQALEVTDSFLNVFSPKRGLT